VIRRGSALRRAALGTALLLAVGSCASAPKPAPPPAPPPVTAPAPPLPPPPVAVVTGAWDELPVIEGGWTYDGARRSARFIDESGLERASLRCTAPGRTMTLALAGERAASADLLTSAGRSTHALTGGAATLGVADIALDRIAFSRGRFGVQASALLVLPVQAEIGRAIEDCRG
jgi:hypothetical protein